MYDFLSGMAAAGFLVAALFFFRFWRRTRDTLFAIFSLAFILFAINQAAFLPLQNQHENESWIYLFRMLGFLLLLLAITPGGAGIVEGAFPTFFGKFIGTATLTSFMVLLYRVVTYYLYLVLGTVFLPRWVARVFSRVKS